MVWWLYGEVFVCKVVFVVEEVYVGVFLCNSKIFVMGCLCMRVGYMCVCGRLFVWGTVGRLCIGSVIFVWSVGVCV